MKQTALLLAFAILAGCSANPHKLVPREAATAICGSPATLTAVVTMTIEGKGTRFAPEKLNVTNYRRTMAFAFGRWKQEETLRPAETPGGAPWTEIAGLDGTLAFDVAPDGTPTRLSDDVTKIRQTELLHHPLAYLSAVFGDAGALSNTRTEGDMEAVDMTIQGTTHSLFIDKTTKLPVKIVSLIHTAERGDLTMETTFADYTRAYGYNLPTKIATKVNDNLVADLNIDQQFFGGATVSLTAPKELGPAGATTFGAQPFDQLIGR